MKVVIPAAGQGTRFLPATKSMPKEMLPVLDRPVIQYVIEEAVAAGADDITIVTGRGKRALEDHFDDNPELAKYRDHPALRKIEELTDRATLHFVRQRTPKGLADAIACARKHVGNEPFGILLGDTINVCDPPLLRQLWEHFQRLGGRSSVMAVETVSDEKVSDYGIVAGPEVSPGVWKVETMVEKPTLEAAPSRIGITGAYFLTPTIFEEIERTPPGRNQEVQLTDAINRLRSRESVYGVAFQGTRYDIGDLNLWLRTNLEFAMKDERIREKLLPYLRGVGR